MEPTIYLTFNGTCLEAMRHYEKTLGGEITGIFRNSDAPTPESRMQGSDDMVLNMSMRLGNAVVMASDAPEAWYARPQGFSVSLSPASVDEFDRLFAALAEDAQAVMMPPSETFWAERFTMFTDRFGTPWMLNFEGNKAMT
ncbi:VOC family protein [Salipiger mangrovisoli]|uniref:VOC family protein n=1 Tax=Salipiger mangrovisoli TaxID=2865933 RepID=A0ABR9X145_9RHOB|nr:VOC family protein [Salipiger mangrovisoli]MBE9637288.1 VOC family protein [Salipiger mangrovisoli]